MWSWSNAINVPKILKWTNSGKLLSLSEYLDNDHFRTNNYLENGIDIVDLSSNQILQAVREAWDRINDRITDSPHQKKTQQQVWDIVLNHEKARRYHGFRHPDARIGMDFLRFAGSEFVK
jgi:putative glycosyltransferase (TIGR04372 family)